MDHPIEVKKFSPELHNTLIGFSCGEASWEIEMSRWISGAESLEWHQRGTSIWLFYTPSSDLIGFASLGETDWKWPTPKSPKITVSIIPALAITTPFQGHPVGVPREKKYSRRIMAFLIRQAMAKRHPLLGLYVHKDNAKGVSLYESVGFQHLSKPNQEYRKMAMNLGEDGIEMLGD